MTGELKIIQITTKLGRSVVNDKFKEVIKLLMQASGIIGDPDGGKATVAVYHLDGDDEDTVIGFGLGDETFHQEVANRLDVVASVIQVELDTDEIPELLN